ncbi:metallophosphoesterase family protein [Alcanivorax sp. MM125-6]|nr:metallophosphoesterase family protein [Alcanivorax sp. MM125-6]
MRGSLFSPFLLFSGALALFGCAGDDDRVEVTTEVPVEVNQENRFITDPFLQMPTRDSVNVVWFTTFEGTEHTLHYGEGRTAAADTIKLSRMMEDASSKQFGKTYEGIAERPVYRHEATASELAPGERVDYRVASTDGNGHTLTSETFSLAAAPGKNQPLKILLTSDLQLKKNAAANYQKVVETVGRPDAVLFAGDLVNVPDRASEWFDQASDNAPAFFPTLQGRYQEFLPGYPYTGGEILQHAPLFATIGNHEVMGRYTHDGSADSDYTLGGAFGDPQPRWYAAIAYEQLKDQVNPTGDEDIKAQWIADRSHNHESYREIFSFPDGGPAGEDYYAVAFGDVFLISMNVSRIWRSWSVSGTGRSKFVETLSELENPEAWGFGEFIFERFDKESEQYRWLQEVLQSDAFKQARYKVVMAHQGVFGLGDNTVPVLAEPVMQLVEVENGEEVITELPFPISADQWEQQVRPRLDSASLSEVRYQYPLEEDVWYRDIEPLLIENGVDLVHIGHSHLWNRAEVEGMHYLESSNVGNSYGAYYQDNTGNYIKNVRSSGADFWDDVNGPNPRWSIDDYAPNGDPQGRTMALPTEFSPMSWEDGGYPDLPFVASNNLSVFSILETDTGLVKSYVFDPADLNGEVQLFDQFSIVN